MKNQLTGKEPGSGENLGQEEKGMTEDKTVRWHHQFIGHELGQTPGDGEGQGRLVCCSPWGQSVLSKFFSRSFIVSGFTFRSLIHFEFIFVYGVRKCFNLIILHVAVKFSQGYLWKRLLVFFFFSSTV